MRKVIDVNYEQLGSYKLPAKTKSYEPVGHRPLVDKVIELAKPKYGTPDKTGFRIAGNGNQMFAQLNYNMAGEENARLSIGIRNSYNKSLAVGICSGASIIVCDNLMFVGDIVKMRKHTVNVWNDLDEIVMEGIQSADQNFNDLMDDSMALSNITLNDTNVAHVLGELFVNKEILTSNQLNIATREWKAGENDSHAWSDRNAWSLYNACTEALKVSHPSEIMDRQLELHNYFTNRYELV